MMKRLRQVSIKQWFGNTQDKKLKSEDKDIFGVLAENGVYTEKSDITMEKERRFEECEDGSTSERTNCEKEENSYQDFLKIADCYSSLSPLKPSLNHTVLINVNNTDAVPIPYPDTYIDKWEKNYVRLPCSPQSLYPVKENGETQLKSRWKIIEESLLSEITNSKDLEEAILKYNDQYANHWDFTGMHDFFANVLSSEEASAFFEHILPKIIRLALQLPQLCTQPIPLLERHKDHMITLSQKQTACLLANAFFCTYPRRNTRHRRNTDPEYLWYPDINFNRLFIGAKKGIESKRAEKLKCLLNYFRRIVLEEPKGLITFHRAYHQTIPDWSNSRQPLKKLHVCSEGLIEKDGAGMLQVDFANKYVGGGVLGLGCVQEEIRYVLCPELILSRLFTERLDASEVLIVTGCEQFNEYSGYSATFKWRGNFQDNTPWDSWKRRCAQIVAMDALSFRVEEDQYRLSLIKRELNKAYCGFYSSLNDTAFAVATGNWGCGVFHGNPRLKSLIQLMAASETHRDIVYFTFGDKKLQNDIKKMYQFLVSKSVTVGDLMNLLQEYSLIYKVVCNNITPELYSFIYSTLTT